MSNQHIPSAIFSSEVSSAVLCTGKDSLNSSNLIGMRSHMHFYCFITSADVQIAQNIDRGSENVLYTRQKASKQYFQKLFVGLTGKRRGERGTESEWVRGRGEYRGQET